MSTKTRFQIFFVFLMQKANLKKKDKTVEPIRVQEAPEKTKEKKICRSETGVTSRSAPWETITAICYLSTVGISDTIPTRIQCETEEQQEEFSSRLGRCTAAQFLRAADLLTDSTRNIWLKPP